MGFDCVICSKLLEEEADPPLAISNQQPIPSKRSNTACVGPASSKRARQQPQQGSSSVANNNNSTEENESRIIVATHCGHLYHKICISQWLTKGKEKGTCPQCRELCSLSQLSIIYPDINHDKETQLQQSLDRIQSLESDLASCKSDKVQLNTKYSELQANYTASKETSDVLLNSMNLITIKCNEAESQLREVTKQLEECRNVAKSQSEQFLRHFNNNNETCRFEVKVEEILNKLDELKAQQLQQQQQKNEAQQQMVINSTTRNTSTNTDTVTTDEVQPVASTSTSTTGIVNIRQFTLLQPLPPKSSSSKPSTSTSTTSSSVQSLPPAIPELELDISGKYELISSRNFKAYLEGIGVRVDMDFNTVPAPTTPRTLGTARKSTSGVPKSLWARLGRSHPPPPPSISWERELVTIKLNSDGSTSNGAPFTISSRYFYNEELHKTKYNSKFGTDFYTTPEGKDHIRSGREYVKTRITMDESPRVMMQVQKTWNNNNNHSRTSEEEEESSSGSSSSSSSTTTSSSIIILREFSREGMRVTLKSSNALKDCVRVYGKIIPGGENNCKKQETCREIPSDDDEDQYIII